MNKWFSTGTIKKIYHNYKIFKKEISRPPFTGKFFQNSKEIFSSIL